MRRKSTIVVLLISFFILGTYEMSMTKSSGAPAGYAGSPGDGATNCLSCHSGPGWTNQFISLTIDGQDSISYIAGQTYDMVVTLSDVGTFNKGGFTISAEQFGTTNKVGTWIGSSEVQVQNNTHVTHKSSSNTPSAGSISWSFQWTAPAAGTGDLRFFVNGIIGDGDGTNNNDVMVSVVTLITEDGNSGLNELASENILLYPNPAIDRVFIEGTSDELEYYITDLKGSVVLHGTAESAFDRIEIPVGDLSGGLFFLQAADNTGHSFSRKIVITD
jgi:hypothetical protein